MTFSERFGYRAPVADLSLEEMPDSLRAGLWDCASLWFFKNVGVYDIIGQLTGYAPEFDAISHYIWFNHFKRPTDERPRDPVAARNVIKDVFLKGKFYEVYDLLEFLAKMPPEVMDNASAICAPCNQVFERERAAFRFVETSLVPITDKVQREALEESIAGSASSAVRTHMRRAAELYSQRPQPDYRNSIKESISAVEAAVRFVTGEKSVGVSKPLRQVADKYYIHPALRDGFEKLYAFTSDAEGIRHSLLEEENLTQSDARYMLVSCSAFANYLVSLKTT